MKIGNFNLLKIVLGVAISLATLISCNNGTSTMNNAPYSNPGTFQMTLDSPLVLNGSESLVIMLQNNYNIKNPTNMKITNSDSSVVNVLEDTCTNNNNMVEDNICYVFLKGVNLGSSTITLSVDGYPTITKVITVDRNWGIVGGKFKGTFSELSATNRNVYALQGLTSPYVYVLHNNNSWQVVANDPAFNNLQSLEVGQVASDESYVCANADGFRDHIDVSVVSCSKNNESWYQLPQISETIYGMSINQSIVYIEANDGLNTIVKYCSIENCNTWQQLGESFSSYSLGRVYDVGIFNTTALIENESKVYFQDNDGLWKLYGIYPKAFSANYFYSSLGLFIMPYYESQIEQSIYYKSEPNLGEEFTDIGNISIDNYLQNQEFFSVFTQINNTIYVSIGDGKIYSSTLANNVWSPWILVGNSPVPLGSIYSSPDGTKLYSTHNDDQGSTQVYTYSLQ